MKFALFMMLSLGACTFTGTVDPNVECTGSCDEGKTECYDVCETECADAGGDTDEACDTDCKTECDETYDECTVTCTEEE